MSGVGRFWLFDLARELSRRGHLQRLYTGYPRWLVQGFAPATVQAAPWAAGPAWALERLGLDRLAGRVNRMAIEQFDHWVSRRLDPCEAFHSLSSCGLGSHREARKRYGALTVCDRGSSHILYQDRLLSEEHARWGVPYRGIDPRIVDREVEEYALCDLIVLPSGFAYRSFVEEGVAPDRLAKVPYGVDLSLFRPVPKEDRLFRVVYVGALSLRKGIPYLLEAVCGPRMARIDVWLIGSEAQEVRPFLAKHRGHYRYLGVVPRSDLHRYYSQGSVFVIASVEDGFGLVQAQAMACGLPVIATANTGAEDLFQDGVEGFIVPIRSPDAIREKVLYLYEHPELREEMGRAAQRRVATLGGWETYGAHMVSAYAAARERRSESNAHSAR